MLIKPDGVARGLVGRILERFESRQFKIMHLKMLQANKEQLQNHYGEHKDRPYFNQLIEYMSSGPIIIVVLEGTDVILSVRKMIGTTNPAEALPGTIRGDFCSNAAANVIHASDNQSAAKREVNLWLTDLELKEILNRCHIA